MLDNLSEAAATAVMHAVANSVAATLPPPASFIVLAFDDDSSGNCRFVSNASGRQVLYELGKLFRKIDGAAEPIPFQGKNRIFTK